MLGLPSQSIDGIEVFADDRAAGRFYMLPIHPRIAVDAEGRPMLRLVKVTGLGDAQQSGGHLQMDLSLVPTADEIAAVREALATEEIPAEALDLRAPSWKDARVTVSLPDGEGLLHHVVQDHIPSALAADRAVIAVDLAEAGATLMGHLLEEGGGAIQVRWSVTFDARMPATEVHASVALTEARTQILTMIASVSGPLTRTALSATGWRDIAHRTGVLRIRTDAGPEGPVEWLVGYVLERLENELIPALFDEADDTLTLRDPPGEGQVELVLNAATIAPWTVVSAGALAGDLDLSGTVIELSLDPLFATLDLQVRVVAPFTEGTAVEVQIEHGDAVVALVFEDSAPQVWRPLLTSEDRAYRVRYRLLTPGVDPTWTDWEGGTDRALILSLPHTGAPEIPVVAAGIAWADIRRVQVELVWKDEIERSGIVVLDQETPEATWRITGAGLDGYARAKPTFFLDDGTELAGDWSDVTDGLVWVRSPLGGRWLEVVVLGAGDGWDETQMVVADLRYVDLARDGHDVTYEKRATVQLASPDSLHRWRVPLREGGPRSFSYKWMAVFTNGNLVQQDWIEVTEGSAAVVTVAAPKRLKVQVLPVVYDAEVMSMLLVRLQALVGEDPGSPEGLLTFTGREAQHWSVELPEEQELPVRYRWSAQWFRADGTEHTDTGEGDGNVLIIPVPPPLA